MEVSELCSVETCKFYCATIAYHVELNADVERPQAPANVQEK